MWLVLACNGNDPKDRVDPTSSEEHSAVTPPPPAHSTPLPVGDPQLDLVTAGSYGATFDAVTGTGEVGTLRCASQEPRDTHVLEVGRGETVFRGLLAATDYECDLLDGDTVLLSASFTTEPAPEDIPPVELLLSNAGAEAAQGYVVATHWFAEGPYKSYRVLVVDGDARVRWALELEGATSGGIASEWLGDSFVVGGGSLAPSLRTLDGEILEQVGPAAYPTFTVDPYNHEARSTPEGLLSLETVPDTDGVITWLGFRVEVSDPANDEVRWSYSSVDGQAAGDLPVGSRNLEDTYHVNAVLWRDDDPLGPSVWMSLRSLQRMIRIDRATKEVLTLGRDGTVRLVDDAGTPLADREWFQGQHGPEIVGNEILVYDNGSARADPKFTRVVKYRLESSREAVKLWDWTEPGWYEPNFGSVQTLPGGHVFVGSGHCDHCEGTSKELGRSWVAEIDPVEGDVEWRFEFGRAADSIYRAQWVDGCGMFANAGYCPGLEP